MKAVEKIRVAHPVKTLFEPINENVLCKNRIRRWAAQNAYTLIFLTFMFFVTWAVILISGSGVLG